MSIHIDKLKISNYKSCVEVEVPLSPFTALIGYNNSGKSNIISAIQWLLRRSALSKSDFNNPAAPIEVIGHISGITAAEIDVLPPRQQTQIRPFIDDGKLRIRRTQPSPGGRAADIELSAWNFAESTWSPNPVGIDNAIGVLLPDPIRIGAMENAEEDATKAKTSTTIGKLLAEFIGPVRQAHEAELDVHLGEVIRRISADGDMRLNEFGGIEQSINQKVMDLFPGIGIRLDFQVPTVADLIKAGTLRVYEAGGQGRDFSSYGHGAQRSIQMALVRHLAEVRRAPGGLGGTTLLLIDEPELYLHPFAIEQVRAALKTLSENGYQVIISTHSAQMVTADEVHNSLLVRKLDPIGTYTRIRLQEAIRNVVQDADHQIEHLFALGNSSQILFSDRVVLAEGKTERRLLPELVAHVRGRTLGQEKYALVSVEGTSNIGKTKEILAAMDIPVKAVVDLDYAFVKAVEHGFVLAEDPSIAEIKVIFQRNAAAWGVELDRTTGLPKKGGALRPAEAYALLAADPDALQLIEILHNTLLLHDIWLWKKGTIEKHLGLASKTELEWARFQQRLRANGMQHACVDAGEVMEMVSWLCR